MRLITLVLRLFAGKYGIMLVGLLLTLLSFGSSIGLLTLSAWFLASCYLIASIDFNIFYPSSSVRGFAIARTFFKYVQRLVTHKATFDVLTKLRVQVFVNMLPCAVDINKLHALQAHLLHQQDTQGPTSSQQKIISDNELFDIIIKDIENLGGLYVNVLIPFLGSLLIFILATVGLCFINLELGLLVGGILILMTLLTPWIFYPLGKRLIGTIEQASTQLRLKFLNFLELQFENLIFAKTADKEQEINDMSAELIAKQLQRDKLFNLTSLIMQLLIGTLLTVTIFLSSYLALLHDPDLRLPGLAAIFIFLVIGAVEIVVPLAVLFVNLGQILNSARNLEKLLENQEGNELATSVVQAQKKIDPEEQRTVQVQEHHLFPQQLAPELLNQVASYELVADNVSFAYPDLQVLRDLSFTFHPQNKYLISGDSGKGKTTLLNCLMGLETSYQGHIYLKLYDQHGQLLDSLEARQGTLRQLMCHLSQRVHIFTDSVFDNLRIANAQATNAQIIEVLRAVELHDLADNPQQILGNGGRVLSGGEIRRIGIARLLLSNAKLFILDEPTESIDSEIEAKMLQLIVDHVTDNQATLILVSHNKNNHSYCDTNLVFVNEANQTTQLVVNPN